MELERKLKRPAVAATPAHALHEREFEYQKSTKKTPKNIIIWRENVHLWKNAFSGLLENCASFNASGGIIIW